MEYQQEKEMWVDNLVSHLNKELKKNSLNWINNFLLTSGEIDTEDKKGKIINKMKDFEQSVVKLIAN